MAKSTTQKNNDSLILSLKKEIEDKKKMLKSSERFSPKTHCKLNSLNLHAASKEDLIEALVDVNCKRMSAESLGVLADYRLCGFKVQDWLDDIQSRLNILNRSAEQSRLKALEEKLHNLLSLEKKVELEIEDIKNSI